MTHRSRSGGPTRQKPGQKRGKGIRKLHHPPSAPPAASGSGSDSEDGGDDQQPPPLPAAAFLETPTDGEILELIHRALRDTLDSPGFPATVQKVKSLLYDKKWLEVFCDSALLESYAARWVPSRAVCYRDLFASLRDVRRLFTVVRKGIEEEDENQDEGEEEDGDEDKADANEAGPSTPSPQLVTRILSLGGGASSELIAIASLVQACLSAEPSATKSDTTGNTDKGKGKSPVRWEWTGVDIGSWGSIVRKFDETIQNHGDIDPDVLAINFKQGDLLNLEANADATATSPLDIRTLLSPSPQLITILFTLTELLTQSRPTTISLVHSLSAVQPGTLLLVADSASDISEFEMGSSGRKWPIWMILDTILLGPPNEKGRRDGGAWELVRKEDSRWYRLPEGLGAGWPVKLENTRYWMRLYRKL